MIKCRHCPKFFLSKPYLQKHYQRQHPSADFAKEFAEDNPAAQTQALELQTNVSQRLEEMAKHMAEEKDLKAKQQEELFSKIKGELFKSLSDNFRRVETELTNIKTSKSSYEEQIGEAIKKMALSREGQS